MNRRSFLRLAIVAPLAGPAIVETVVAAVAPIPVVAAVEHLSAADMLNAATLRYIRKSPRLIDGIFQPDPLYTLIDSKIVDFPRGRAIESELTFDDLMWGT